MASVTKGYTFGATETVTNAKLHTLVDSATITGIVNADVGASANIDASKLNLTSAGYLTTGSNFTITGTYTYSTAPTFSVAPTFNAVVTLPDSSQLTTSAAPTSDADIANKKYVDDENLWEVDGTEHQLKTADEIDMQSKKIINVLDPTADQDACTKNYADNITAQGKQYSTQENDTGSTDWYDLSSSGSATIVLDDTRSICFTGIGTLWSSEASYTATLRLIYKKDGGSAVGILSATNATTTETVYPMMAVLEDLTAGSYVISWQQSISNSARTVSSKSRTWLGTILKP